MVLTEDLLNPSAATKHRRHKLKNLVQAPRSFFMDVKCPGCMQISIVYSHVQTTVVCDSCSVILCTSTGGKGKLTGGCSFRKK